MNEKALNILFVEDSDDDVELTIAELTRGGYDITAQRVETSDDMRAALATGQWEVIISDFKMPELSAERSLALFKESALEIPFIIISGVVEAEDVVYLLKKGAHDFLNKRSLARLVPAIERELRDSKVRAAQRQAEEKVSILSLAVEQSPVSVVITHPSGIIEYVNPKFESTTGYSAQEAIGRHFGFSLMQQQATGSDNDDASSDETLSSPASRFTLDKLWLAIQQEGSWSGELCHIHKDGMLHWEYINVSPLEDRDGNIIRFVSVQEDITARRSYEEQLRNQAHYDDLTGLANRTLMMNKLDAAVQYSGQHDISTALLCIDLDHFKNINDTLGHKVGDELLVQVASRLAGCTKKSDTLARMGGDEFVVILPKIDDNLLIQGVANRIMEAFAAPFTIFGQEHFITASIGVAKYPENSTDPEVLLRNADLAMYQAKAMGRNQCQFFSEAINNKLKERVNIESLLRGVELRDELELYYQPIVDGSTNEVVICEALLRWRDGNGQYVMPDVFIPIAEETGLIHPIGEWVIRRACKDLKYIHQHINPKLKFAINISPKQLQSSDFFTFVNQQLVNHRISSDMIELEITESVLIHDIGETTKNLNALCNAGFSLSIDDFGTGYSSLGYLQKYPFSTLKIDRSFISQIEENTNNAKLTETMIYMAHGLGMQVVAEGVETKGQLQFLQDRQCELIQGYLFSKPVPLKELIEKLGGMNSVEKDIQ
jgi:diguanylate cyclase (GGDEF)-like protein/PAS domain S-box-containing protein